MKNEKHKELKERKKWHGMWEERKGKIEFNDQMAPE